MKVWNYIFGAITMLLILQFAGIPTSISSGFGKLFNIGFDSEGNLNSTNIGTSNITSYIWGDDGGVTGGTSSNLGWLSVLIGTGVAAGLLVTGRSDIAIKAGFAVSIAGLFVTSLYTAVTYALSTGMAGWAVAILAVIFIPYTVGFIIALVYFVAGGTSD